MPCLIFADPPLYFNMIFADPPPPRHPPLSSGMHETKSIIVFTCIKSPCQTDRNSISSYLKFGFELLFAQTVLCRQLYQLSYGLLQANISVKITYLHALTYLYWKTT